MLLVLDNAVSEKQVRPLLPGSPACAVLITARCPLPGLAEATALTLPLFPTSDAVRMLEQVAGPERVGGSEAATSVASQCGHLPLALRIAGARLRTRRAWTVETLAAFMEDERQRLGRLAMGELGVRASFSLSYQQLEPEAARTFRLVSLLGMPEISVGVAAAVTDRELSDTEAALEQLVDAALVEPLMPDRYRFHDLLRLYARERAEAEESAATRRAVVTAGVDWYLTRILEAAVLLGPAHSVDRRAVFPRLADALAWLDTERENLVRAVAAAGEDDLVVPCWQMADALFRFYELRRYLSDWQQVNQIALQAAERAGLREVEGRMHNGIGYVYAQQARFDQALTHLEAALAIRREVGDAAGEGRTLKTSATSASSSANLNRRRNVMSRRWRSALQWGTAIAKARRCMGVAWPWRCSAGAPRLSSVWRRRCRSVWRSVTSRGRPGPDCGWQMCGVTRAGTPRRVRSTR